MKRLLRAVLAFVTALTLLPVTVSKAYVYWGERVKITEDDTVLDEITVNGVTVPAYYSRISVMTQAVYDNSRYSCSEFAKRFYLEAYGIQLILGSSNSDVPASANGGFFTETDQPVIGDLVTKKTGGSHYAVVKDVLDDGTAVLIEQNLWSDRTNDIALKGRALSGETNYTYWHWSRYLNLDQVEAFVTRLYRLCLGREPDAGGFATWKAKLADRSISAAEAVRGFFLSKEMTGFGLSDEDYVERCYAVLMDRESDEGGKAGWVEKLANGYSRVGVLRGFVESKEFTKLCASYGITRGTLSVSWRDQNAGVTFYVVRLYRMILEREYDAAGLNGWCRKILTGQFTAKSAAMHGFFHSIEFQRRELADEDFVRILYKTFLDREYDENGLAYWLDKLTEGMSRDACIAGFADSAEFRAVMARYGFS